MYANQVLVIRVLGVNKDTGIGSNCKIYKMTRDSFKIWFQKMNEECRNVHLPIDVKPLYLVLSKSKNKVVVHRNENCPQIEKNVYFTLPNKYLKSYQKREKIYVEYCRVCFS